MTDEASAESKEAREKEKKKGTGEEGERGRHDVSRADFDGSKIPLDPSTLFFHRESPARCLLFIFPQIKHRDRQVILSRWMAQRVSRNALETRIR